MYLALFGIEFDGSRLEGWEREDEEEEAVGVVEGVVGWGAAAEEPDKWKE